MRLKEIMRVLPDLAAIFGRHFGERSHCVYLYSEREQHILFSVTSPTELLELFPEFGAAAFAPMSDDEIFHGFSWEGPSPDQFCKCSFHR